MADPLESSKTFFSILKDGAPVVDVTNKRVNVFPQGATKTDLSGPWQTASYTEHLQELDMLASLASALGLDPNVINYDVSAIWDYNGQYISDFHVSASGTVQVFSNLSIDVQTYDADYDDSDVAQMKYDIICMISNLTGGSKRLVIHAQGRGDGGGMSLSME
jgi:hypothetical protein